MSTLQLPISSSNLGRHPALPATNNLLQLPTNNNSNNKKRKGLIRSLSKSKIPAPAELPQPQDVKASNNTEEGEMGEKEYKVTQSAIRDTLLGDDKISVKVLPLFIYYYTSYSHHTQHFLITTFITL